MNELIYFWIDKYRQFQDPNTHTMKFLFNDFGINLSSKYKVIHEKMDDGSLQFTINESKIKKFFQTNLKKNVSIQSVFQMLKPLLEKMVRGNLHY